MAGAATRQRCKADSDALAGHVKAGSWRLFEISAELNLADAGLRSGSEAVKVRRETLMKAGATQADAERIAPDADLIELQAKIAGLEAERAQIARFFVTRDPAVLPGDFAETIQAYKTAQHVVDEPVQEPEPEPESQAA